MDLTPTIGRPPPETFVTLFMTDYTGLFETGNELIERALSLRERHNAGVASLLVAMNLSPVRGVRP